MATYITYKKAHWILFGFTRSCNSRSLSSCPEQYWCSDVEEGLYIIENTYLVLVTNFVLLSHNHEHWESKHTHLKRNNSGTTRVRFRVLIDNFRPPENSQNPKTSHHLLFLNQTKTLAWWSCWPLAASTYLGTRVPISGAVSCKVMCQTRTRLQKTMWIDYKTFWMCSGLIQKVGCSLKNWIRELISRLKLIVWQPARQHQEKLWLIPAVPAIPKMPCVVTAQEFPGCAVTGWCKASQE